LTKVNENIEENFEGELNSEDAQPSQSNSQVSISKQLLMKIAAGGLVLVVAIAAGVFVMSTRSDGRITDAVASCGVAASSGITFAEDGQSLVFDGKGEDDFIGGDFRDVECLLNALEAPSTIWAQMLKTTSLMGQQESDFDGINVSWSYHPDNGLNVNFEITG